MYKKISVLLNACSIVCVFLFSANVHAAFVKVNEAENNSVPSEWKPFDFDVTSLISGASSASLSFDLRNDAPPFTAGRTTSEVWFDSSTFSVSLNYLKGGNTSHWRNVQLLVDGKLYVDQFGAYNNHLGHADYGTSSQGGWGSWNIAGQSGAGSNTYLLTEADSNPISDVPVPAALWLFGSALVGLMGSRRKSSNVAFA